MLYQHNIDNCLLTKKSKREFEKLLKQAKKFAAEIYDTPIIKSLPNNADLKSLQIIASHIQKNFTDIVILGTGGSTLCPQTLTAIKPNTAKIKLHYVDYIDPIDIENLRTKLPLESTCFLVISKSGRTMEILAQFLWAIEELAKAKIKDKGKHFVVISDPTESPIRTIANEINATILDHEKDIGGRYAIFTNVGLLPALISGIDAAKILQGAKYTIANLASPTIGASLITYFIKQKTPNMVFMPYVKRLQPLSYLFRQLWAEGFGKDGKGITPLTALGTIDQHSQLQLYLDGPSDKWFTLVTLNTLDEGHRLKANDQCLHLKNRTLGDVQLASQEATISTMIDYKKPIRIISLEKLDEESLGAIIMHIMLETIIAAKLLKINPFDQPAVESNKIKAKEWLIAKSK